MRLFADTPEQLTELAVAVTKGALACHEPRFEATPWALRNFANTAYVAAFATKEDLLRACPRAVFVEHP